MRILLWHGYLLGGTGSNVYTRALAREWSRAGHDVVVFSQDPHPDAYDLGGAGVVRPEIGGLLPVFVFDRYEGVEANYIEGTPFVGANVKMYAGPGGHRGEFDAWDPIGGAKVWSLKEKFPVWSGALSTAGDVVFYGTMDGWFKAVHAKTGELLWQFKVGSGIIGQPVSYKGPDGKQYVAVLSGVGGWAGAIVVGDLDPRDQTAALGMVGAMRDLPQATTKGGMLYAFALP